MQSKFKNRDTYLVIGVMSGTSLDGLDLAAVEFQLTDGKWHFDLLYSDMISYSDQWHQQLKQAPELSGEELTHLHFSYGKYIGEQLLNFMRNKNFAPDLIASHGHTVFHQPEKGFTLQIGSGEVIARLTGVKTVADFRTGDMILGGQGAPLVPIGDRLLFPDYDYCLNLGGFANISFEDYGKRRAYDVCPVNIVLNNLAEKFGKPFDKNGEFGRMGVVNRELLQALNSLDYYSKQGPKSLGREWVEQNIFSLLDGFATTETDKLRTFYEHISCQIGASVSGTGKMLATGGGAFNSFLIERIKAYSSAEIVVPLRRIIEFKEALIFAFLGLLRELGQDNCLASVTGASHDSSSGVVFFP